ncbi:MAG: hypothetical protein Q4A31_05835 [Corynebacterium sp.]|uniref:hypothetical protein n=1 Tax=Corynebacterium sp. TaxID=1720 RepID=UPI0026DC70DA|nr:hypothetical protein [Corynebacterium sp.]MDO4761420.1 hypothetical protein [Corynebacterium sp.]
MPHTHAFRRRHTLIPIVTFSLMLGLSGCSNYDSSPQVPVEEAVGIEIAQPRVTVINEGTGAKTPLRFADIDNRRTVEVFIGDGFSQELRRKDSGNTPAPLKAEAVEPRVLHSTATVMTKKAENSTSTRSVFVQLNTPEFVTPTKESLNEDLATARGFGFGWFASDTGEISSVNFTAPTQATDNARALVEQHLLTLTGLPVVFPEAAVGVGASWTVESRVQAAAQTYLQTVTYTLKSFDADSTSVVLGVDVAQRPSLGALDADGKQLKVVHTESATEGELKVDLGSPLPVSGKIATSTQVVYGEENSEVDVVQESTLTVEFR